jgi:hypothetical protein
VQPHRPEKEQRHHQQEADLGPAKTGHGAIIPSVRSGTRERDADPTDLQRRSTSRAVRSFHAARPAP